MPRRTTYAPKHRAPHPTAAPAAPPTGPLAGSPAGRRARTRTTAALSGVAVVATGLVVSSGVSVPGPASGAVPGPASSGSLAAARVADPVARSAASVGAVTGRSDTTVSRSDRRTAVDKVKKRTLDQRPGGATTRTEDLTHRDPRTVARAMLGQFGFGADQFSCLDHIYTGESGWDVHADNPSSSAYGIPQALPGAKMASAGADWHDNAATQIKWGLGYIKARYGTPCSAWGFKQGHGWY